MDKTRKQAEEAERRREALAKLQSEIDDWKQHPTTQVVRRALSAWQDSIKSQWAAGQFNLETLEATALANHKAASEYGIIAQILNLDAELIEGIFENESED